MTQEQFNNLLETGDLDFEEGWIEFIINNDPNSYNTWDFRYESFFDMLEDIAEEFDTSVEAINIVRVVGIPTTLYDIDEDGIKIKEDFFRKLNRCPAYIEFMNEVSD